MKLKKLFPAVLALVLVFSLAITAYGGVLVKDPAYGGIPIRDPIDFPGGLIIDRNPVIVDGEPLYPQVKISNKKAFPAHKDFDTLDEIVAHLKDNSTGGDISVDGNKLVFSFEKEISFDKDLDIENVTQGLLHNGAVIKIIPPNKPNPVSYTFTLQKMHFIVDDSPFKANTVKCYSNQNSNPNPEGEVFLSATDFRNAIVSTEPVLFSNESFLGDPNVVFENYTVNAGNFSS